jgi:hypothetical protein
MRSGARHCSLEFNQNDQNEPTQRTCRGGRRHVTLTVIGGVGPGPGPGCAIATVTVTFPAS